MTEKPPSPAYIAMSQYFEQHNRATLLLLTAAQDYAAARCLLQHGLLTGLVLGAQAIEKVLKAYLLLHDPKRQVKRLSHSFPKLLQGAHSLYPQLSLDRFAALTAKFGRHYQTRYPDNSGASTSMTSADIHELDTFVVFLNENLPCPHHVKCRTGFYAMITFSLGYKATVPPTEFWIKKNNQALIPLMPHIAADYADVMREIYP